MSHKVSVLASVLGAALLVPALAGAQGAVPAGAPEPPTETQEPRPDDEAQAEVDPEKKSEAKAEDEEALEDELSDESPDSLRDPLIGKLIKRRVVIDRPRFSLETGGKVQVQYFDADSNDPENEDALFLRRVRPFLLGHFARNWTWKAEVEISADIEARDVDFDQLDIRDFYVRYAGFEARGWRLTFGNQKAPFSRDFMTPSTHRLVVERTFVGDPSLGVPERPLGIHVGTDSRGGKVTYFGSVGVLGHDPGVDRLTFDSLVGGGGSLNEGVLAAGRLDLHPRGAMSYLDGDPHTPTIKYTWSLAGYVWENDGTKNSFTEEGIAVDPERADLDSAAGLELSGGLRGRGITLDWQYNRIRGETVAKDFSGGLYVGGVARLDVGAVEGGYRFPGSPVELGGVLSRFDVDSYATAWDQASLALNLRSPRSRLGKLQITHSWIWGRDGVPGADFRETRIQFQYLW